VKRFTRRLQLSSIVLLYTAVILTSVAASCRPPNNGDTRRAFAVDVAATEGFVTLDGWACPQSNDWCGVAQKIVDTGNGYGHVDFPALLVSAPSMNFHIRANGYLPLDCVGSIPPGSGSATASWGVPIIANRYHPQNCPELVLAGPPPRTGAVVPVGKAVRDDQGFFHPEGMTFFWAMHGVKYEPARLQANVDWLIQTKAAPDYVRILAQVDWAGNEIDPNWPDYNDVFLRTLDVFAKAHIRVEVTVLGSPYNDPSGLAHRLSALIRQRPAGTVIAIEVWNEWSQNGGSIQALKDAARIFLNESGVPLVGLSSSGLDADIATASAEAGATLRTDHSDRGEGDGGWRMVRQCFGAKDMPGVVDENEPPGPNSSINVLDTPIQLAMFRACNIQSGGALWVLHVGDMVQGIEDPAHNRHPNLWQVANLPAILQATRIVDKALPDGVENWSKTAGNPNTNPQVFVPDIAGWPDGHTGVNRFYAAIQGGEFTQTLLGVAGTRVMTLRMPGFSRCSLTGFNPETLDMVEFKDVPVGFQWTIAGRSDGLTGYVLHGICQ
jgi:hypothetical protein